MKEENREEEARMQQCGEKEYNEKESADNTLIFFYTSTSERFVLSF